MLNINFKLFKASAKSVPITFNRIKSANNPHKIPIGIAISASIIASYNTFFFICFGVAPTDASIPYCLIFSVIDIAKLFRMQKILVTIIITITTTASDNTVDIVESLTSKFS